MNEIRKEEEREGGLTALGFEASYFGLTGSELANLTPDFRGLSRLLIFGLSLPLPLLALPDLVAFVLPTRLIKRKEKKKEKKGQS
jgi:hypothetical protein